MKPLTRLGVLPWLASLAFAAGGARAGTLFSDPYGAGSPDVLGSEADFDIRSLEVQELGPSVLRMELRLDYHGGDVSLAPFSEAGTSFAAVPVGLGDVLIQGRSSLWAIPLVSSGTVGGPGGIYYATPLGPVAVGEPITRIQVLPGSLYRVSGSLTAGQVLGVSAASDLRADEPVWGAIESFAPDYSGFFPVATPVGGPEISIQLQIATGPAFYADVSGGYRVHFASATCACDVIDGAVPEPGPLALASLALALGGARLCLRRGGGSRARERV